MFLFQYVIVNNFWNSSSHLHVHLYEYAIEFGWYNNTGFRFCKCFCNCQRYACVSNAASILPAHGNIITVWLSQYYSISHTMMFRSWTVIIVIVYYLVTSTAYSLCVSCFIRCSLSHKVQPIQYSHLVSPLLFLGSRLLG